MGEGILEDVLVGVWVFLIVVWIILQYKRWQIQKEIEKIQEERARIWNEMYEKIREQFKDYLPKEEIDADELETID